MLLKSRSIAEDLCSAISNHSNENDMNAARKMSIAMTAAKVESIYRAAHHGEFMRALKAINMLSRDIETCFDMNVGDRHKSSMWLSSAAMYANRSDRTALKATLWDLYANFRVRAI